ncbi:hypothetical protein EN933_08140 [Mesorhizobium sp. M7A.F.Ca.US.001.01.1.1]|nr:hypothetical protein EN933_08140 [Mesorhizobium sp. M7A.F.Ca.US.001.01.1.1]
MPAILVSFAVRCLLVGLFLPLSALDKVLNFDQAIGQASQAIPGRAFATVMIAGGFCIEVFMSLAILGGVADPPRGPDPGGLLPRDGAALETILAPARFPPERQERGPGRVLGFPQEPRSCRRLLSPEVRRPALAVWAHAGLEHLYASSGVASPASRVRDFHEVLLKAVRDVTGAEVPFLRWNTTGPVN